MVKKRVLNSKNPKYWEKQTENKPKIKKRVLFCEVKGCKMYGTWYEDENIEDKVSSPKEVWVVNVIGS